MNDTRISLAPLLRLSIRWDVILSVCCALAACGLWMILTGCKDSPTEPRSVASCEVGCNEQTPAPLSPSETLAWMQRARSEVQAQADRGEIRLSVPLSQIPNPSVEWRACPWSCSDCYDQPGGGSSSSNICAAGMTTSDGRTIRVSTWERDRRGPLVMWETRNSLWLRTGNGRLAHGTEAREYQ